MSTTVLERVYDGVESRIQIRSDIWSEVLVGDFVIFTIHINLILNILDLYSFIVIYCDYGKE
jgi:hypothetical protein